ncbi:tetratricopeptide repeat protein [bacterium]|nr:tetratricopeptide repeat protein [bacterium]
MFDELDSLLKGDFFFETQAKEVEKFELKEGERRVVTILFADVKGFTALSEKLDSEQVKAILDKILKIFTFCIEKFGGYVDKYEGDLIMALFGAKQTSVGETEHSIFAAFEMLESLTKFNFALKKLPQLEGISFELGIRIGINTGLVTTGKVGKEREGDFTVYGDAVNLASRMESNAPVNTILIPEETKKIVENVFDFESKGEIEVKGKSKPVSVFVVKNIKNQKVQRWNVKKTVFVGRKNELEILNQKFKLAKKQTNFDKIPLVAIKSPAGLGKSRFVYEFLKLQNFKEQNFYLKGFTPSVAQNPYCVFTSMLKRFLSNENPEISKENFERSFAKLESFLESEKAKHKLKEALPILAALLGFSCDDVRLKLKGKELQIHFQISIKIFLEAVATKINKLGLPLLIVLEDVSWLDESSKSTLNFLLDTLNLEEKIEKQGFKSIFFLLTYRNDFLLSEEIRNLSDFTEIELFPLSKELSKLLIKSILAEVRFSEKTQNLLLEKSAGNPFYIEEWVSFVTEKGFLETKNGQTFLKETKEEILIPNTLNALILSRVDQLPKDLKLVLKKASVIGSQFSREILFEIEKKFETHGSLDFGLNGLEELDFIARISKSSNYIFKNILVSEVAYNTLLFANRKVLHKITAKVIEEIYSNVPEEFYYELAKHYEKAEIWEKAIFYLEKAGDKAKNNFENDLAIQFYSKLLSKVGSVGVLLKRSEVFQLIGFWQEAIADSKKALEIAENFQDEKEIIHSYQGLGWLFYLKGHYDESFNYYEKSIGLSKKIDYKKGIAKGIGNIGNIFYRKGNYEKAMKFLEKQLEMSEEIGYQNGVSRSTGNIGVIYKEQGNYEKAMEFFERKLNFSEETGDKIGVSRVLGNIGIVYESKGDFEKAMEFYDKKLKLSEELGDKNGIATAIVNQGVVHLNRGDNEKAKKCFEQKLKISEELGDKMGISFAIGNLGVVFCELKDYEKSGEYFAKQLELGKELEDKSMIGLASGNLGVVYQNKGDFEKAMENFRKKLEICEELQDKSGIAIALDNIGSVYKAKNDYATAKEFYEKAILLAKELGIKYYLSCFLIHKAELLFLLKDFSGAKKIAFEGLKIGKEIGSTNEHILNGMKLLENLKKY